MIQKQELLDLAADFGLQPNVVEKDYVLGWLLGAEPHATPVFQGGTCLKKCFFETYPCFGRVGAFVKTQY